MNYYHDPVRHLEYLRQSLSQDDKPIGFFISAGCPLSVEMSSEDWPLIPDVKNLTIWINNELSENPNYIHLLDELGKANKDRNNIEDILSFIRGLKQVSKGGEVRGLNEETLNDLEYAICERIVTKINVDLPNSNTPYHKLTKWISSIDREVPIEIFTTNYDLLMEKSLESMEVPYFDGFVGSNRSFFDLRAVEGNLIPCHWTRLWKIHGSINWYQMEDSGQKKVYRSSEIKTKESHLIYPSHLKYEQSRKMPYLALIDKLDSFIRQKSSLLILSGYSFNDEHLNDTIINALKANPSAMVIGLMFGKFMNEKFSIPSFVTGKNIFNAIPSASNLKIDHTCGKARYPKAYKLAENRHNLSIWTDDKAIIGTNPGEWMLSNKEHSFSDFINSDENIRMGNFSVLTDFLKTLINSDRYIQNKLEDGE